MTNTEKKKNFSWVQLINALALLLCALCLILIATSLQPLSKWANYQSTCVEQESQNAPISWAVRKCNGRSKVYQVK